MYGVTRGVIYNNQERFTEIDNRISERNYPSTTLQMTFDPRAVTTRRCVFPALDCHSRSSMPVFKQQPFDTLNQFNPGTSAPYSGYATKVDEESRVQNMFMPTQKWTAQTKFVPSSRSDLYVPPNVTTSQPVMQTHPLLFKEDNLAPFNPNPNNMGHDVLYNHTRQQIKNL